MYFGDDAQRQSLSRLNFLAGEQETAPAIRAKQFEPQYMDPVSGNESERKMRQILEIGIVGADHDVAKQCQLGMDRGWSVDDRDHRYLDIDVILDQPLAHGDDF